MRAEDNPWARIAKRNFHEAYRMRQERNEARMWARRMKKERDQYKALAEAWKSMSHAWKTRYWESIQE